MFEKQRINYPTVVAALATLLATPSNATSATLEISGVVEENCSIVVTGHEASLDLSRGETAQDVATISETCNDPDGYSVTFASTGGTLDSVSGAKVAYSINYASLEAADLGADTQRVIFSKPAWDVNRRLTVNVAANANLAAGRYSDTITITIAGL